MEVKGGYWHPWFSSFLKAAFNESGIVLLGFHHFFGGGTARHARSGAQRYEIIVPMRLPFTLVSILSKIVFQQYQSRHATFSPSKAMRFIYRLGIQRPKSLSEFSCSKVGDDCVLNQGCFPGWRTRFPKHRNFFPFLSQNWSRFLIGWFMGPFVGCSP